MSTRSVLEKYFKQWDKFVSLRDTQINGAKFEKEQDKFVLALFARINAISNDIVTLARKNQFSSSRILMRPALETFVDLKCLVDDPEYLKAIKSAELGQNIKYLKHYSPDNEYYSKRDADKQRLVELKKNSDPSKYLSIFQRFEKAGELKAYRTVYNKLCLYSHGNISALASDNFKNGHVVLNAFPDDATVKFIMSSTVNIAIAATVETLAYFDHEEKTIKPFKDFLGLK